MGEQKDDIAKYLKGELTPKERHALEKKALVDPFLAEALEGAETISHDEFMADTTALNKRVAARGNKNKSWSTPLRIAATVALLLAAGFTVYLLIKPSETVTIANLNSPSAISADSVATEQPDNATQEQSALQSARQEESKMKQSEAFSQASRQAAPSAPRLSEEAAGGGALTREAPAPAMEKMADTEELNPNQASPVQAGGAQIVQAKPADGPAKNTARSGDDQPGRSSEVTEKTDALALADKKRKAVEAEAKSENGINPGVLTPFSPNYSAAPADGSVAFTNYLKKNLHYPVAALEKKMEGTVVVEFIVATDGSMTGFKAVQKLGLGCDEEAIRLVQFGPRWKPAKQGANPISSTARVDVEFSIPK